MMHEKARIKVFHGGFSVRRNIRKRLSDEPGTEFIDFDLYVRCGADRGSFQIFLFCSSVATLPGQWRRNLCVMVS